MNLKQMVVLMCVASIGAGAFAFTFIGPPTAELEQGQWKAGYSYTMAETDLEFSDDLGLGLSGTMEDVKIDRHYFDLGYGLAENLELNVLLGVASTEYDDLDYDGGNEFSWGFNTKYTFASDETIDWGAMFQMTWFSAEEDDALGFAGADVEIDMYDLQVAVGPTVDMGGWDLYGGAFYYMLDGDVDVSGPGNIGDIEEEDNFGGFVGAQFQIAENTDVAIEYAFSSDSSVIGASIGFRF